MATLPMTWTVTFRASRSTRWAFRKGRRSSERLPSPNCWLSIRTPFDETPPRIDDAIVLEWAWLDAPPRLTSISLLEQCGHAARTVWPHHLDDFPRARVDRALVAMYAPAE